ncbi:hypothetical protein ACQKWADRAFT_210138 [Trichoderma austrokoningii]
MGGSDRHVESQIAAYPAGEVGQRTCRTQRLGLLRLTSGFSVDSVAQLPVYQGKFPFPLYSVFRSLAFISLGLVSRSPSYIFFMYIPQLANPMLGFPCSAIPSSRLLQRPKIGHVRLGGCRDQDS